jgi:hypothetical protein
VRRNVTGGTINLKLRAGANAKALRFEVYARVAELYRTEKRMK